MASLSSLLWWWHRQPQHWFPKRGKLQGGLLELQASPCCCSGVFVALFHVWAARAAVWVLDALADFPGGALQRAGATAKGKWAELRCLSLSTGRLSPALGGFCSPEPSRAASLGSALAAGLGLCSGRAQGESPRLHSTVLQLPLTCLCRQLILLIVLQKCCMFFSSLQSHSLELR